MTITTLPDRDDPDRESTKILGIDLSTPCMKTSFMNGIGSGMIVGVAYNLVKGLSTNDVMYIKKYFERGLSLSHICEHFTLSP